MAYEKDFFTLNGISYTSDRLLAFKTGARLVSKKVAKKLLLQAQSSADAVLHYGTDKINRSAVREAMYESSEWHDYTHFNLRSVTEGQRRVGAVTSSIEDMLLEGGFDYGITDYRKYGNNARLLGGLSKSSLADVSSEHMDMARQWVNEEISAVEETYKTSLLEVSKLRQQNEILRIQKDSTVIPSAQRAIQAEISQNQAKINALRSGVSGLKDKTVLRDLKHLKVESSLGSLRSRIADLNSIALKLEASTAFDMEGVPDKAIPEAFNRLDRIHAADPELGKALEAYKAEVRQIRSSMDTTTRFFKTYGSVGAGPMQIRRGGLAGALVEIEGLTRIEDGSAVHLDEVYGYTDKAMQNLGVLVKPRGIARAGMLEGMRHEVITPSTLTDSAFNAAPFKQFYALTEDTGAVDRVGRGVQQKVTTALDAAIDSVTAGKDLDPRHFRAYETARSLYMGTLYRTQSLETNANWGSAVPDVSDLIDDLKITNRTTHKSLLASILRRDDEFSTMVKDLLFEMSPELQQYAQEAPYINAQELPKQLADSARRMDIPVSNKGFRAEIKRQIRIDREADAFTRRVSDEFLMSMEHGGVRSGIDDPFDPDVASPLYRFRDADFSESLTEYAHSRMQVRMESELAKMYQASGETLMPESMEEAFRIVGDAKHRDFLTVLANLPEDELRRMGMSKVRAQAFGHLRQAATAAVEGSADPKTIGIARAHILERVTNPDVRAANTAKQLETVVRGARKRAYLETMHSPDPAISNLLDYAFQLEDVGSGYAGSLDPFVGGTRGDLLARLNDMRAERAVLSVGTEDFRTHVIMEGLTGGLADSGNANNISIRYSLQGNRAERIQALLNMGLSNKEAERLSNTTGSLVQDYEFRSFADVLGGDAAVGFDQADPAEFAKRFRGLLSQNTFLSKDEINDMVEREMEKFSRMSPATMRKRLQGLGDIGGIFPVENSTRVVDFNNAYFSDLTAAAGRINTVSADRATFGQALLDRAYGMGSGFGRKGDRSRFANESIFQFVDGKVEINSRLLPRKELATGGSTSMEMSDGARSVLNDIINRLGGDEEMARLVERSGIDPISDIPRSLIDDIFDPASSAMGASIRPYNKLYGPLAGGNMVDIYHDISHDTLSNLAERVDFDPNSSIKETLSLNEVFARALASGELGDAAPGPDYATMFVHAVRGHSERMGDERLLGFYGDDARRIFSGAGEAAEGASSTAAAVGGAMEQTPITRAAVGEMFKHKSVRYGAAAAVGFGAWGIYRSHRRNKDRTMEDMTGPTNLPGGSPYENGPQGFTTYNTGDFSRQASGVTYRVDVHGNFDPRQMMTEMNGYVDGSTVLNVGENSKGIHRKPRSIEDLSNGY